MKSVVRAVAVMCAVAAVSCPAKRNQRSLMKAAHEASTTEFQPVSMCVNCHIGIGAQYYSSMHSKSLSNPVFRAQYYRVFLPASHEDPEAYRDEPTCLRCHAPVAYMRYFRRAKRKTETQSMVECTGCHGETGIEKTLAEPGVICDVCHRIEGFRGDEPGNGNYIAKPGNLKFGPFQYESDFHRQYNELQTKAELCAICHNSSNRFGVDIRTTYTEWKAGPYAKRGIQCQDCHMNKQGFLTAGKPVYESGKAAFMTVGQAPERDKLYTHRFFGAHSRSQIEGALTLEVAAPERVAVGDEVEIRVRVDNGKTGHSMPTGSVELRSVWLEVTARMTDDSEFDLDFEIALAGDREGYGVVGGGRRDDEIYDGVAPDGARIYRVVFTDADGRQEYINHEVQKRVFDNRLKAGETRDEVYRLEIPEDAHGWIHIDATLYYLRFPPVFAKQVGIRSVDPVPFARGQAEILAD